MAMGMVNLPAEGIAALCRKYSVEVLSVFGSVLRVDFRPDSDVDFLVVFKNEDLRILDGGTHPGRNRPQPGHKINTPTVGNARFGVLALTAATCRGW